MNKIVSSFRCFGDQRVTNQHPTSAAYMLCPLPTTTVQCCVRLKNLWSSVNNRLTTWLTELTTATSLNYYNQLSLWPFADTGNVIITICPNPQWYPSYLSYFNKNHDTRSVLYHSIPVPNSKHNTLTHCWINVGPASLNSLDVWFPSGSWLRFVEKCVCSWTCEVSLLIGRSY